MTENVAVISSLPDTPTPPEYNASVIKSKFDEASGKLKAYINDTLIPDIEAASISGIAVVRKLIASFRTPGNYSFDTSEYPSAGGIYDVILIGGGGGGSVSSTLAANLSTGGGSGGVTKKYSVTLDGEYMVKVGAGGASSVNAGSDGDTTMVYKNDYSEIYMARGGSASSQTKKIGKSGGIGGTDSFYLDGSYGYGRGGDNEYGLGVRGAATADDVNPAEGYGAGGWGSFNPTGGAVYIYGYKGV